MNLQTAKRMNNPHISLKQPKIEVSEPNSVTNMPNLNKQNTWTNTTLGDLIRFDESTHLLQISWVYWTKVPYNNVLNLHRAYIQWCTSQVHPVTNRISKHMASRLPEKVGFPEQKPNNQTRGEFIVLCLNFLFKFIHHILDTKTRPCPSMHP